MASQRNCENRRQTRLLSGIYLTGFWEIVKLLSMIDPLRLRTTKTVLFRSLVLVRCSSNGVARWWNGCSHLIFLYVSLFCWLTGRRRGESSCQQIIVSLDVTLCILRAACRFKLCEERSYSCILPPQFFLFKTPTARNCILIFFHLV
jgi:hypothetical protein